MHSSFENIQIDLDSLPKQEDLHFVPLERSYLNVSLITVLLFWSAIFIFAFIGPSLAEIDVPEILLRLRPFVLIPLAVLTFLIAIFGFRKKGYALRDKDIMYKSGLIWKSITTIPFSRIQHCEVKEGPIERIFGLSSLHIYTAGGSSSDIDIPGLHPQGAQDIKEFVLQKINDELVL